MWECSHEDEMGEFHGEKQENVVTWKGIEKWGRKREEYPQVTENRKQLTREAGCLPCGTVYQYHTCFLSLWWSGQEPIAFLLISFHRKLEFNWTARVIWLGDGGESDCLELEGKESHGGSIRTHDSLFILTIEKCKNWALSYPTC